LCAEVDGPLADNRSEEAVASYEKVLVALGAILDAGAERNLKE